MSRRICDKQLESFTAQLYAEERAKETIEKYLRDVWEFTVF